MTVLVVGEGTDGHLVPASREAVSVARSLAGDLAGVVGFVGGSHARAVAGELGRLGITRILVAEDARLDRAPVAATAPFVAAAADAAGADLVLVGGTTFGRDLVARLSVRWSAAARCRWRGKLDS